MDSATQRVVRAVRSRRSIGRMNVAGSLAIIVVVSLSSTGGWIHAGLLAISGALLVLAAVVDMVELRLPNRLLAASAAAALLGSVAAPRGGSFLQCAVGGATCGGAMLFVHLRRGVGMGDVKAAAAVGMGCGSVWLVLAPVALAIGAVTAAITGVITRRARLALGPSLVVGWVVALAGKAWWVG